MAAESGELGAQPPPRKDPADFSRFWRREYPAVVRLTLALTGRRDMAEELAQDAFLAAYRQWPRVSGYDQPGAWVRRVATNAAVSTLRRRSSELKGLARLSRQRQAVVESSDEDRELWDALRRLPRRQAQVLALVVVDDLSVAEVARVLEVGEETVRTHLRRGRATLADRLGLRDEGEGV